MKLEEQQGRNIGDVAKVCLDNGLSYEFSPLTTCLTGSGSEAPHLEFPLRCYQMYVDTIPDGRFCRGRLY